MPNLPEHGSAMSIADFVPMLMASKQLPGMLGVDPGEQTMSRIEQARLGNDPQTLAMMLQATGQPTLTQEQMAALQRYHQTNPGPGFIGKAAFNAGYELDKALGQALGRYGGPVWDLWNRNNPSAQSGPSTSKASLSNMLLQQEGIFDRSPFVQFIRALMSVGPETNRFEQPQGVVQAQTGIRG